MIKRINFNRNKSDLIIVLPFLIIMGIFFVASFFKADQTRSETENRMLAQKPRLTGVQSILTFPESYENYYNDQLPGREKFLKIYTGLEILLGKIKVRNLYNIDGFLMLPEYLYTAENLNESAQKTNELMEFIESTGKTGCYISLPYKTSVYNYMLPKYLQTNYGEMNFKNFTERLEPGIKVCDAFRCYRDKTRVQLEKYFFKTDIHWNVRGAEIAYRYILDWLDREKLIDIGDTSKISFDLTLIQDKTYLGDLNRRYSFMILADEDIPVFSERSNSVKYYLSMEEKDPSGKSAIMDETVDSGYENYNSIYTNNLGYYRMVNENALINTKVLVIKDSMQNAMTDMFSHVFHTTEVVDVRHLGETSLYDIIQNSEADLVLLMYHQNNVTGEMFNFK